MIGIICAMDAEIEAFIKELKDSVKEEYCKVVFYKGKLYNQDCVVVKGGYGKADSARTTTLLIEHFPVNHVFNIGLGGGNGKYVTKHSFVIADKIAYHDVDLISDGRFKYGQMQTYPLFFEADKETIDKITSLYKDVVVGGILSGDSFASNQSWINDRLKYFESYEGFKPCVFDMEGASISQICYRLNVKFNIIRYVSDIVESTNQIDTYFESKKDSSYILIDIIKTYLTNI